MQIDRITLANFKCFSALDIAFPEGVNLLVGANGSGKTALLEALCVAAGGFFGSWKQKMQRVIKFEEIKLTRGIREPTATVKAESERVGGLWGRTIKENTRKNDSKFIRVAKEYGAKFFEAFENHDDRTIAPLIAYFSTQRLFIDAGQSKKQSYDAALGRKNGYVQCLEEKAIKPLLVEWLGNAVTRRATMNIQGVKHEDHVLGNVEEAIRFALMDCLDLSENFPLKIYQDPDFDNETYLQFDEEAPLPLAYYSDGFRNLLFLVIDMVWRASQLNPWLNFSELKAQVRGVVMIDEIDLHLHPRWQAKAVPLIQRLFPKVQFFITTHSPTVVANFENGHLYIVEDNQIRPCHEKYLGKEINAVLRNVLNANDRHIGTQKKLERLFGLIEQERPQEELQPLVDELKTILGLEDRDLQNALSLIEYNANKINLSGNIC